MATRAAVPVGHVELPFGHTRQYSLQLFEPLHVHGSLHRPPPFVSRREPTRLRANCNRPANRRSCTYSTCSDRKETRPFWWAAGGFCWQPIRNLAVGILSNSVPR